MASLPRDLPLPSSPSCDSPPSSPTSILSNDSVSASTSSVSSRTKKNLRKLQPAWRSPVWEFFSIAEDMKFAKCKNCTELVARGGDNTKSFNTTTNLVHHLKTKHSEEFSQLLEMKKKKESERETIRKERSQKKTMTGLRQLTLQKREDQTTAWNINDPRACIIHKKLAEMH